MNTGAPWAAGASFSPDQWTRQRNKKVISFGLSWQVRSLGCLKWRKGETCLLLWAPWHKGKRKKDKQSEPDYIIIVGQMRKGPKMAKVTNLWSPPQNDHDKQVSIWDLWSYAFLSICSSLICALFLWWKARESPCYYYVPYIYIYRFVSSGLGNICRFWGVEFEEGRIRRRRRTFRLIHQPSHKG